MSTGYAVPWGVRFVVAWLSGTSILRQTQGGDRGVVTQLLSRDFQLHQQLLSRQVRRMAAGTVGGVAWEGPGAGGGRAGQLSRVRILKSAAINDIVMPNTTQLAVGQYGIRALTGRRVAANTIEAMRRLGVGVASSLRS
jgi:hypothetical protein